MQAVELGTVVPRVPLQSTDIEHARLRESGSLAHPF